MVIRAAILAALLAATCRAAWSPEWTDGTQTNELFTPPGRLFIELVLAANERIFAANLSSSSFFHSDPAGRDLAGTAISPLATNDFDSLWTNTLWTPSVAQQAALIGKVVEVSSRFVKDDDDNSFLTDVAFEDLANHLDYEDDIPRWAYAIADIQTNSGALTNIAGVWQYSTNYYWGIKWMPLMRSMNPKSTFFADVWNVQSNRENLYVLEIRPETNTLTQTVRRAVFDAGTRTNIGTNSYYSARLKNGPVLHENTWDYDQFVVRFDSTNVPDDFAAIGFQFDLYVADTNSILLTGLAGAMDEAMGLLTNTVISTLPYSSIAPGISGIKFLTTNTLFPETMPEIVAEIRGLRPYGDISEEYLSPLREGFADWAMTWPEMLSIRDAIQTLHKTPSWIHYANQGKERGDWAATNYLAGTNVACGDLLSVSVPARTNYTPNLAACWRLDGTNLVETNTFGSLSEGNYFLTPSDGWGGPVGKASAVSEAFVGSTSVYLSASSWAETYVQTYVLPLNSAYTNRPAESLPRIKSVTLFESPAFNPVSIWPPFSEDPVMWEPLYEIIVIFGSSNSTPHLWLDGAEADSGVLLDAAFAAMEMSCSTNAEPGGSNPNIISGWSTNVNQAVTAVVDWNFDYP